MTEILPVIHHYDDIVALEQAKIAYEAKAHGVFLISHCGTNDKLGPLGQKIKNKYPGFKVGINLLGDSVMNAAQEVKQYGLDMVWADSCGVSSAGLTQEGQQLALWAQDNNNIEIYASVAFKYQRKELEPKLAADNAKNAGFIPTTSGQGTGSAPSVEKIKNMSNGLLAVASGMDCENVSQFAPYLSHILVATGVSLDEHHFDKDKLEKFIDIVKQS